jgi:hypothetical protein
LFRATSAELRRVTKDPELLQTFLESIEGSPPPMQKVRGKGILGFLLRLSPITIWEPVSSAEEEPWTIDPDKLMELEDPEWAALHFLLTVGTDAVTEPACFLTTGGEALDDEGTSRCLGPEETRRFANYLSALSPAELERRFDPKAMRELGIHHVVEGNSLSNANAPFLVGLLERFSALAEFARKSAAAGDGMIIRIA